ncbi:Zn-dependent amino- or carboxypeptidase, M28 family [Ekhidna lutea]|uniref:Zn-dependent amino- or carboxypeptidase, M28 family n=1 Tax=Ekhidna lutea TaxID=447679 RepID=A0A239LZX8_EKHLU|nr:M28 family metallopeptidase [Ekhidna lutea]SNT35234.1 Zn-dependent amino- or carboxypeptidase, M28 family [Ekhidna lutea]
MKKILVLLAVSATVFSCSDTGESSSSNISEESLRTHIEVLSSDDFQGRKPFTQGEIKTVNYLTDQFKEYGLEPGNGDSYIQEVPLVELTAVPSETMTITGGGEDVVLNVLDDFVAYTEQVVEQTSLDASELVFAGYGVVAPEYGWNDYEGLDVKGKTVVVLVNDPGFASGDSTFFKGETMTYYGRWTYKFEEAARQGAAGCLIIHETVPAGYPWLVVRNSWSGASLYLDQSGDNYQPDVLGWITRDAAIKIFEASEQDMKNYSEMSRSQDFKPFSLGLNASVSVQNKIKRDQSQNVIAKITGSERPDEYIIYSAHWDHLGIGQEIDGDSIYNGAHDNASGTATMLGIAEAMSKMKKKPKRTVIFLAVTAEEQGLLGSKHYAQNPIYPPAQTVANINMDGITAWGPMKDLTVVGYGQSELEDIAEEAAKKQGRYILADPDPGKGYFFRSDHFQFAKVGIPALYASGGYEHMTKGVDYVDSLNQIYLSSKYHRPQDEYDATSWTFDGMALDGELLMKVGLKVANSKDWPSWKEGSEFKAIREESKK